MSRHRDVRNLRNHNDDLHVNANDFGGISVPDEEVLSPTQCECVHA